MNSFFRVEMELISDSRRRQEKTLAKSGPDKTIVKYIVLGHSARDRGNGFVIVIVRLSQVANQESSETLPYRLPP